MSTATAERRLSAILAADVVGYSRAIEADEEAAISELKAHRSVIFSLVADHHGRVFGTAGDSVLAEFSSPVEAVRCAVAIQSRIEEHNAGLPEARRMRFRIGVNLGDIVVDGDDLLGDGVNVAARLEALAEPSEICISRSVLDHVRKQLPFSFEYLGRQQVKNLSEPIEVYRLGPRRPLSAVRRLASVPAVRRLSVLTVAPMILVLAFVAGWWTVLDAPEIDRSAFKLPDRPSIAVLPFDIFSEEEEQRFLAQGLAEDIITDLARNSELTVMARPAASDLKDKGLSARRIGDQLGVHYVLGGSLRRAGEELRMSAKLVDSKTGNHVWAESYNVTASDLYEMQDEIVEKIVGTLFSEVRETEKTAVLRRPPRNLDVYELSLRGLARKHRLNPEDMRLAREDLLRAVELDPLYAPAWLYLGWVESIAIAFEWIDGLDRSDLSAAIGKIEKAIGLDPTLATGYQALSIARGFAGDVEGALQAAKRSVALGPGDADNLLFYARALANVGQFDEAVAHGQDAMALNPSRPSYYSAHLGRALWGRGGFEESLRLANECLTKAPKFTICRVFEIASHAALGNADQASQAVAVLIKQSPDFSVEDALKSSGYPGDPEADERLAEQLVMAGLPAGEEIASGE